MKTNVISNVMLPESTTRVLRIARPTDCDYKIIPGAGAILSIDGTARPFSFANGANDLFWTFFIREVPGGEFYEKVKFLVEDDSIEIEEFFRYFDLQDHEEAYYFATGTGLAPFACAMHQFQKGPRILFYGAKTQKDLIPEHVMHPLMHAEFFVSREEPVASFVHKGYITQGITSSIVSPTAKYYICGLADMVQEVSAKLMSLGVTHNQIAVELFYAKQ